MPNRILRDYSDSMRFDGITAEAERLFIRLIIKADDYGRYHAEPRLLRAGCYPLSEHLRTNDLARWLDELSTRQLILRYEVGGRPYLEIAKWNERACTAPKFPAPPWDDGWDRGLVKWQNRILVLADGKCAECGATEKLSVDHILPVKLRGTGDISNLQCLCSSCNSSKGSRYGG